MVHLRQHRLRRRGGERARAAGAAGLTLLVALAAGGCRAPESSIIDGRGARPTMVYEGYPAGTPELLQLSEGDVPRHVLAEGSVATDPVLSPDARRIAYVVADYDAGTGDVWIVNVDGTGRHQLTTSTELDDAPAWSPDGTRLAWRSYADQRSGDIWVASADGGGAVNLTPTLGTAIVDHHRPSWSPDGMRIAMASTEGGDWGIWTMRADGGDRVQLTNTIDLDTEPAWSPDGTRIAFRRSSTTAGSDIAIVPAAGGATTVLSLAGEQRTPEWSPDGTRLVFASQPTLGERPELYSMRPDGSDLRLVTTDPSWGGGVNPSWRLPR